MKKIFAIMFSIVMMTVCGNEVKAQTNDAQQNYEVSGSLTSSNPQGHRRQWKQRHGSCVRHQQRTSHFRDRSVRCSNRQTCRGHRFASQ